MIEISTTLNIRKDSVQTHASKVDEKAKEIIGKWNVQPRYENKPPVSLGGGFVKYTTIIRY